MLVNTISTEKSISKNFSENNLSFGRKLPRSVEANRMRIFMTQDIYSPRLHFRKPQSLAEKEVLLEILNHRLNLDRYVNLTNAKFKFLTQIDKIFTMAKENSSSPELVPMCKKLLKQGNPDSILKTYTKSIEAESIAHKDSLDYFKKIEQKEIEYRKKGLITEQKLKKVWNNIKSADMNPKGKYSTKELIKLVEETQIPNK